MRLAQEHQVLETRLAVVRPVFDVMRIDEALAATAVFVLDYDDAIAIAGDATNRFNGRSGAALAMPEIE
jgi:hypothetical protein